MDVVGESKAVDETGFPRLVPFSTKVNVTGSATIGGSSGTGSKMDGSSSVSCGSEDVSSVLKSENMSNTHKHN